MAAANLVNVAIVAAVWGGQLAAQSAAPAWLDRPLVNWNTAGASLPKAELEQPRDETLKRCKFERLASTPAERALADAGWIPFLNFDQRLTQADLEIVGGMTGADGMCRPLGYNVFLFVGGRFAGTLSPARMNSRADGASGAVRFVGEDTISAEFARYTEKDALCCPSSRMTVRYRIERSGVQPIVAPIDIRTTRSF